MIKVKKRKVISLLRKAWEILDSSDGLAKGNFAKAGNDPVFWNSRKATCFCLVGAVYRAANLPNGATDREKEKRGIAAALIELAKTIGGGEIPKLAPSSMRSQASPHYRAYFACVGYSDGQTELGKVSDVCMATVKRLEATVVEPVNE